MTCNRIDAIEAAVERVTEAIGVLSVLSCDLRNGMRFHQATTSLRGIQLGEALAAHIDTALIALAEANERASLLQTAVHERCAERDEARKALAASEARRRELERERDEAIKDRDAQAQHVLKVAAEAQDGFAALEEIDACWDQYGHKNNRAHLTLSEQIASTLRELEDMSENYGNAEGELKLAEERIAEFEADALNPHQEGSRDHGL